MSASVSVDDTAVESAESRLARSRDYCRDLTRTAAKNFYYGLRLLPQPKRAAMFALYAYMRLVDDIADADDGRSTEQREVDLEQWKLLTQIALRRELPGEIHHDIWPAFSEMVQRYRVPAEIFDEAIAGQQQDLRPIEPANFDALLKYCHRVAGTVGLASVHIWGFQGGQETLDLALARGVAFQLTNILRDVSEDAAHQRIYLPRDELAAMNVSENDLLSGAGGEHFRELMKFQVARAESYFQISQPLEDRIERDSRPTLVAMTDIYHQLLKKIAADPDRVLRKRVSLSMLAKLRIGWRAMRSARSSMP